MACDIITDYSPANCVALEIGGVSGKAYGINYKDWITATITRDETTGAITAVVLTTIGAKAVEYDLPRGASITGSPLTVNDGGKSGFAHSVQMFIPTKDAAIRAELATKMNYGRMVWIIVLDSTIVGQVFGNDVGLQLTAFEEVNNDPSKGGGMDVTFTTPADVTLENLPPVEFFDTDRATTEAAYIALKTPVS